MCPTAIPSISPFGSELLKRTENANRTHGRYGAEKMKRPRKDNLMAGFRLDHIYTRENDSGDPRKGRPAMGDNMSKEAAAYKISHAKSAVFPR